MILAHPDNMKLLQAASIPPPHLGFGSSLSIEGLEVRVDSMIPKTAKTGRVVWPKDPFVTYEESDRQWGLALGICTEEEAPAVFKFDQRYAINFADLQFEPVSPAPDEFREYIAKLQDDLITRLCVPSRVVAFGAF